MPAAGTDKADEAAAVLEIWAPGTEDDVPADDNVDKEDPEPVVSDDVARRVGFELDPDDDPAIVAVPDTFELVEPP